MKLLFLLLFVASFASAQKPQPPNSVRISDSTVIALKRAKKQPVREFTGQTYTDANGKNYVIYRSVNDKLFIEKTSKKTGNVYRYYIVTAK